MPSDITDAITQDQIAESLLGTPAPTEETQPAGAEAQEEVAEETQTVDETAEVETQETADDWLPTEQEKVFPAEVLAKYAPRYGFTAEELEGDPRIARIVQDKLNSDIFINQLQSREEAEETAQPAKLEPTQPQLTMQQHLEYVGKIADSIMDKDVAMAFATQLYQAGGGKELPTPEAAQAMTKAFTVFGLNLLNTVLQPVLKEAIRPVMDEVYPDFSTDYDSQSYDRAWRKGASSVPEFAGKSLQSVVPQLEQTATRLYGSPQEFERIFSDKPNGEMSYPQRVKAYSVLAKQAAGQKLTSSEAKTFVEAGKKAARQQQIRRETGNLGSGKSNGQISGKTASGPFQTNNDLFDAEAIDLYRQQHGSL